MNSRALNRNDYYHENVSQDKLAASHMDVASYSKAHEGLPIACHDAVVWLPKENGFLMVTRRNEPVDGHLWFLGGRILRGVPIVESLTKKIVAESGIVTSQHEFLYLGRTCFPTDPFGHGKGTDTVNLTYICTGEGDVNLDNLHSDPVVVTQHNFDTFKPRMSAYVIEVLECAFAHREKK